MWGGWLGNSKILASLYFYLSGVGAKLGKIQQSWVNIGLQQICLSNFFLGGLVGVWLD